MDLDSHSGLRRARAADGSAAAEEEEKETLTSIFTYRVPGERTTCPACGASDIALLEPLPLSRRSDGYRVGFISGCTRCGLVFANPFPSEEELTAFYSRDGEWGARRSEDAPSTKAPPLAYVKNFFGPIESWFDVTKPPAGGRILDVGCGNGELLDVFQDLGWETWGIEPSERAAFRRHRELHTIPDDQSFHVVILHHVLEHVGAPLDMLRAVRRALRPQGLVAVSVPRLDALPVHRDFRYCINSRTHVLSYTRECLATLLGMAGFAPVDVSPPLGAAAKKAYVVRRLQMLGVNDGSVPQTIVNPLKAARRALRAYEGSDAAPMWQRMLPVRFRAGRLNRTRRTKVREGQSE